MVVTLRAASAWARQMSFFCFDVRYDYLLPSACDDLFAAIDDCYFHYAYYFYVITPASHLMLPGRMLALFATFIAIT